jgi:hypothetical protein
MPVYRGVLHVHSTLSDGTLTPEQVRDLAVSEGLDFVVLCEHASYVDPSRFDEALAECARLSDETFLLMLGLEFEYQGRHILLLGPPGLLREADAEAVGARPEELRARGGLTIWAHPACTYHWTLRPGMEADYDGWEVWNRGFDGAVPSLPMLALLRKRRRAGRRLRAFAGADLHQRDHRLTPLTQADIPCLTPAALIEGLRHGRCRASGGASGSLLLLPDGDLSPLSTRARLYARTRYCLMRGRCLGGWTRWFVVSRGRTALARFAATRLR